MEMKLITICKYELKYNYYLTEGGRVWSEYSQKFLKTKLDRYGYEKVSLMSTDEGRHLYSVHRLMLENYNPVDNMAELHVNHIDGVKTNNHISNLEWATPKENIQHACRLGLRRDQRGTKNNMAKFTEEQVLGMIHLLLTTNLTQREIGARFGASGDYVSDLKCKRSWTHLTQDIDFSRRLNDYSTEEVGESSPKQETTQEVEDIV
jgi:YesN/AraC family two-component response regulator